MVKISPSLPTVLTDPCAFQQGAALRRVGNGPAEGGGGAAVAVGDCVDATIAYVGRTHARKEQGTQLLVKWGKYYDIFKADWMDAYISAGVCGKFTMTIRYFNFL